MLHDEKSTAMPGCVGMFDNWLLEGVAALPANLFQITGQDFAAIVGTLTAGMLAFLTVYQKAREIKREQHARDVNQEIQSQEIRLEVLRKAVREWERTLKKLSEKTPDPDGTSSL